MRYEVRPTAADGGYGVWDTRRDGWVKDGNGQYCGMHPADAAALAAAIEADDAEPALVEPEHLNPEEDR